MVIQWGDAHVWKIGGKVFAVGGWSSKEHKSIGVTFKCSPETFCELKHAPGMRPAPYLASRGFIWLQWLGPETVSVSKLKGLIVGSYTLVAAGLSQKKRRQLGIEDIV
jgi:predicted DNA-binding protein (MmcQ/YjbR family)